MVYNFTVADFHTYFVSELGIWVHNTDFSRLARVIVSDISEKVLAKMNRITKVELKSTSSGSIRFSGVHSKIALHNITLDGTPVTSGYKATINDIQMAENGVYSAKVKVETDDGTEVIKSGNEGNSTFFPIKE